MEHVQQVVVRDAVTGMTGQAPRTSSKAVQQRAAAARKRGVAAGMARWGDATGARWEWKEAAALEARAQAALTLSEPLAVGIGGEAAPVCAPDAEEETTAWYLRDTLKNPDLVTAVASYDRQRLALAVGCLEGALDTAETIGATNSVEKMLAHQLAAAHHMAMTLLAKSRIRIEKESRWQEADTMEGCRLVNAASRLMSAFTEGVQTLHKLRSGGKQTVVVQHVHVTDGGQAVVAGEMRAGGTQAEGSRVQKEGTMPCPDPSTLPGARPAAAPKRGRARRVKRPRAEGNGAAACTGAPTPAAREVTSTP